MGCGWVGLGGVGGVRGWRGGCKVVILEGTGSQIDPSQRQFGKLEVLGGLSVLWGQAWGQAQEIKSGPQALCRASSSQLWS